VRYDYRLNGAGRRRFAVSAGNAPGSDPLPRSEYVHPRQLKALSASPVFPGAVQTPGPD
jgi:hypothetical protein